MIDSITQYIIEKDSHLNEKAVTVMQALKWATKIHLKGIDNGGFGKWLKGLPGAIDAMYKLSSFGGALTGKGSAFALKTTAAFAAPPLLAGGIIAGLIITVSFKVYKTYI